MLEGTNESVEVAMEGWDDTFFEEVISKLPFEISVPRAVLEGYHGRRATQTCMSEQRRFVRFLHLTRGILRYRQTYPTIRRASALHSVLITNVSKTGVGLLNFEQLFPGERMTLWMSEKDIAQITIGRCRKINDRCYDIGAIIGG